MFLLTAKYKDSTFTVTADIIDINLNTDKQAVNYTNLKICKDGVEITEDTSKLTGTKFSAEHIADEFVRNYLNCNASVEYTDVCSDLKDARKALVKNGSVSIQCRNNDGHLTDIPIAKKYLAANSVLTLDAINENHEAYYSNYSTGERIVLNSQRTIIPDGEWIYSEDMYNMVNNPKETISALYMSDNARLRYKE